MPSFRQRDATDCGACCLAFVAAHHRKHLPLAELRLRIGTGPQGSTALGLVEAAREAGFAARGVKGGLDDLGSLPLPAIAHCHLPGGRGHYVVLLRWTGRQARVMDPATGRREKWPRARFAEYWTGVLILLAPADSFEPSDGAVSPTRRLWRLLQPHRGPLLQALFGALVSTVLGLGTSVFVQQIVDRVLPDDDQRLLNLLGAGMLMLLVFRLVLGAFQSLLSLRTAQRIDAMLVLAYYRHLLRLPQPFFDTMRAGEIVSRVADAVKIRNFLNQSLPAVLLNPLILLVSLGAMFGYSPRLALLSLALVPLQALLYGAVNLFNRRFQRALMERSADFDAQLVESLHVQPVIRRFGLETHFEQRIESRLVRLLRTSRDAALGGIGFGTASSLLTQGFLIGLLWLGAEAVLDTRLTPGALLSCYTLAGYLAGPITSLLGLNASIQEALIATDRLFEIMDLELEGNRGTLSWPSGPAPEIRLESVAFRHAGRPPTLAAISLVFPPGRITALVGESGGGKSTLLALLQRLYAPSSGRITLGGVDLNHYRLENLRRLLGVLPQHTVLLSGTILENLAPGAPAPDFARILEVCRTTGLLEFIERLPQGFATPLAENGADLSGGQRQRLALARALYRDPPVLLLDEPTSALDHDAAETIRDLLQRLRARGKTIIVATHHPRLTSIADRVVTLAAGRVVAIESCDPDPPTSPQPGTPATAAVSVS